MNHAEASVAVLEELKRLRKEGLREVYIEDETLRNLQESLGSYGSELESVSKGNTKPMTTPEETPSVDNKIIDRSPVSKKVVPDQVQVQGFSQNSVDETKFLSPPVLSLPDGDKNAQWKWLEEQVIGCSVANSELNENVKILFGRGNLDAEVFFCGEAPNEEDDSSGKVFGGEVGELLSKIIQAMGYDESSVYLSNILHWRPKYEMSYGHRPPTIAEMKYALPYLHAQLNIVQPKVVVALGKTATDGMLGFDPKRRLGDVRGIWHEFAELPLMVTYHPSYLLHNPSKSGKRKVWEDMLKVMERVGVEISERQRNFFL